MTSRERFEQAIKARFGDLIDYRVCKNSDGEYMAWDMQVAWWAWQESEASTAVQLANAESKCRELAAENAWLNVFIEEECFVYSSHTPEPIDANDCKPETPATDAFLAEVRASAIPEGYVLVPQEMHLSYEAMEGICFHCGDGGFAFGEFTDGLLFVGAIDDSDGQKIHGLHIATADYPEEGCATICEFLPVPHRGAAR